MRGYPYVAFIMNHITTFKQIICTVTACLVSVIGGGIIDHMMGTPWLGCWKELIGWCCLRCGLLPVRSHSGPLSPLLNPSSYKWKRNNNNISGVGKRKPLNTLTSYKPP